MRDQPLVHFLLIGVVLFAVHAAIQRGREQVPDAIVVGASRIESITSTFAATRDRAPTPEELKGLLDEYVREEVLVREATRLGLDRDDPVIRRRLRQKMEFVAGDVSDIPSVDEAALAAWLRDHPDGYRVEGRTSLRQIFVRGDPDDAAALGRARDVLARLSASPDEADSLGDPSQLPPSVHDATDATIAAQFGEAFATAVSQLVVGTWNGPVRSTFGVHLVRVDARTASRVPGLEEVREVVLRDWQQNLREELDRRMLDRMLEKYAVRIEWPRAARGEAVAAELP